MGSAKQYLLDLEKRLEEVGCKISFHFNRFSLGAKLSSIYHAGRLLGDVYKIRVALSNEQWFSVTTASAVSSFILLRGMEVSIGRKKGEHGSQLSKSFSC